MIGIPRRNSKIDSLQGPLRGPFFLWERDKMAAAHNFLAAFPASIQSLE
jgi:hypothetical protein